MPATAFAWIMTSWQELQRDLQLTAAFPWCGGAWEKLCHELWLTASTARLGHAQQEEQGM